MTPEERVTSINAIIWHWLPVRWTDGRDWWEVLNVSVTGDDAEGGVDLLVCKNSQTPVTVSFTNAEVYGNEALSYNVARERVMAA